MGSHSARVGLGRKRAKGTAVPQAAGYRNEGMFGSVETVGEAGVFGQVMGLVAVTVGFFTLGAYLGRNFTSGASIICFILGFVSIIGLNFARRSEGLAITMLFAAGLFLGSARRRPDAMPNSSRAWTGRRPARRRVRRRARQRRRTRSADLSRFYRILFFALLD